jgi:hypothetical protein
MPSGTRQRPKKRSDSTLRLDAAPEGRSSYEKALPFDPAFEDELASGGPTDSGHTNGVQSGLFLNYDFEAVVPDAK